MKQPWSDFPFMLATNGGMILSPRSLASAASGDPAKFQAISAGPYVVGRNVPTEVVHLEANPKYWKGTVKIAKLEMCPMAAEIARDRLQNRQTDVALLYGDNELGSLMADREGFLFVNSGFGIARNTTKPALADPRTGQAMIAALDTELLNQRASKGAGPYGKGLFAPGSRWESAPSSTHDPERAKALVSELKQRYSWDGTITFTTSADNNDDLLLAVKAQLDAVGFVVAIDRVPSFNALFQQVYVKRDFEAVLTGLSIRDESPWTELEGTLGTKGRTNISAVSDAELDSLLTALASAADPVQKEETLAKIQKVVETKGLFVPVSGSAVGLFWQDTVHGLQPSAGELVLLGEAYLS